MTILGDITEVLYWEWRCAASELNLAKKEKIENELKYEMMLKDLEIARLRSSLFKTTTQTFVGKVSLREADYNETKLKIEKALGQPLPEGSVINEQLQVIVLDEPKENKG